MARKEINTSMQAAARNMTLNLKFVDLFEKKHKAVMLNVSPATQHAVSIPANKPTYTFSNCGSTDCLMSSHKLFKLNSWRPIDLFIGNIGIYIDMICF